MKPGESQPLLTHRSNQPISGRDRIRSRATWTLPIVIMTYFFAYYTPVVLLNPFLYDQVSQEFNYSHGSSSQKPCADHHRNETDRKTQARIQKEVATLELYLGLPYFLLAALSVLVVGPLTDKYGRRIGFVLPIVGSLLKQIVYAIVIGLKLHPLFLTIGHFCDAIGGSFAAMFTSMFTVVSDVTEIGPQRSFRITLMEAAQTMTGAAGSFAMSHWIRSSYLHPLLLSSAVSFTSLASALFLLPETLPDFQPPAPGVVLEAGGCQPARTCLRGLMSSVYQKFKRCFVLFINDACGRSLLSKRRLCLVIFILVVAVNFASPGVTVLYLMKQPRCWSASTILTYGGVSMVSTWVAILLLMRLLQRVFKMADRQIAMLGVVSSMISAIFMSLAVNDTMIYEAAALGVLVRAIIPMMRSVTSSVVDKLDQGAVYATLGCVESLCAALFTILVNRLYSASLDFWDGTVFILFAGLMLAALVLLIILNLHFSRDQPTSATARECGLIPNSRSIQADSDPTW